MTTPIEKSVRVFVQKCANKDRDFLSQQHLALLKDDYGITPQVAAEAGLFSADQNFVKKEFKFENVTGLAIPYTDINGQVIGIRLRNDTRDKGNKYVQPPDSELACYFAPHDLEQLKNLKIPLIVVEGELKALALRSSMTPAFLKSHLIVALPGANNWRSHGKISEVYRDLICHERTVYVVPDSDVQKKPNVRTSIEGFLEALYLLGANLHLVLLPQIEGLKKTGLDDFILERGNASFISLLAHPSWTAIQIAKSNSPLSSEQIEQSLAACSFLSPIATASHIEHVHEHTNIAKRPLNNMVKKLDDKWNKLFVSEDDEEILPDSLLELLKSKGRAVDLGREPLYFYRPACRLLSLKNPHSDLNLFIRFELCPGKDISDGTIGQVAYDLSKEAQPDELHKIFSLDKDKNFLHFRTCHNKLYRISETETTPVAEQSTDLIFHPMKEFGDFELLQDPCHEVIAKIIEDNTFAPVLGDQESTKRAIADALTSSYYARAFFKHNLPLIAIVGSSGNGKSTLSTRLSRTFNGKLYNATTDFDSGANFTAVANSSFLLAIDNCEEQSNEVISLMSVAVSGGAKRERKLFHNFESTEVVLNNIIQLTSLDSRFTNGRADLRRRVLFIPVTGFEGAFGSQEELLERIYPLRDHFWSSFILKVPNLLKVLKSRPSILSNSSMNDFIKFTYCLFGIERTLAVGQFLLNAGRFVEEIDFTGGEYSRDISMGNEVKQNPRLHGVMLFIQIFLTTTL